MNDTKAKLQRNEPALGSWIMIGHPTVVELMAAEGFDWLAVDMEHTSIDIRSFHELCLAAKGSGCDLFARLHSCDPVQTKQVLDAGADGIIVPFVNTADDARQAVAMAKYPPDGFRGAAFCRASDFGRNFPTYFRGHNKKVFVAVMIEHIEGVKNVDAILSTTGVDAAFIGPYDLSASMGRAGDLEHPEVKDALKKVLDACQRHNVPPGIHIVPTDRALVERRLAEGFKFIAASMDTEFLLHGSRTVLGKALRRG